jgi:hypothetical protein
MQLAQLPPYRFDQSEKVWAAIIAIGLIYVACFAFIPGFDRFGWPCFWKQLTAAECAGCGFTRACAALIQMDWTAALHFNPLVFLVAPFLGWKLLEITFGLGTGRSLQAVIPRACRLVFIASLVIAGFIMLVWRLSDLVPSA